MSDTERPGRACERLPAPLRAAVTRVKEYARYRRTARELEQLPDRLLWDMGANRDEVRRACSGFSAWRRSRFGRPEPRRETLPGYGTAPVSGGTLAGKSYP